MNNQSARKKIRTTYSHTVELSGVSREVMVENDRFVDI